MRQGDVDISDAVAIVRGELEVRITPAKTDVRMVISVLGQFPHAIDEAQSVGKILKFEMPPQLVLLGRPAAVEGLHRGRKGLVR